MPTPEGLQSKFRVSRVDGRDAPGGDKADARYFVLDYVHDENARAALMLYADLCEDELPALAADLRSQLEATVARVSEPCPHLVCPYGACEYECLDAPTSQASSVTRPQAASEPIEAPGMSALTDEEFAAIEGGADRG